MGTLRLLLALLVLVSHTGRYLLGLNPGVVAVVVFYVISGYVMAALFSRHYLHAPRGAGRFYADRALRLYPQYLFYAAAAVLWLYTLGHPTAFLHPPARGADVFNNLAIVPLNLYMFNGADRFTAVPPAWSLGAEVLFYLLLPLLAHRPRLAWALAAASLAVQALAWHGQLHTDWWGYRLLPGVLWLFVLGMALHRHPAPGWARAWPWAVPIAAAGVALYLQAGGWLAQPYHREVLLGTALAVPAVHLLTGRCAPRGPWARWDERLGNLSYGVFLNHFLCMWVLGLEPPQTAPQWALLLLASLLGSAASFHWLEQPVMHWRRRWRAGKIGA